MNVLLLGVIIFTFSLLVLELSLYAFRTFIHPDRAEVRRRLRQSIAEKGTDNGEDIYKKNALSEVPFMHSLLARLPGIDRLQLTMNQANVKFTLGFFILFSITIVINALNQ